MTSDDMRRAEQRFLKDLVPQDAKSPQELAPEPVVTIFKSWQLDIVEGIDPVSGTKIISMVYTAGNFTQQFMVNMNGLQVASLIAALQKKVGPVGNGNPT